MTQLGAKPRLRLTHQKWCSHRQPRRAVVTARAGVSKALPTRQYQLSFASVGSRRGLFARRWCGSNLTEKLLEFANGPSENRIAIAVSFETCDGRYAGKVMQTLESANTDAL